MTAGFAILGQVEVFWCEVSQAGTRAREVEKERGDE